MFVEFPDLELDTKHGFLNSVNAITSANEYMHNVVHEIEPYGDNIHDIERATADELLYNEGTRSDHTTENQTHTDAESQALFTISDYSPEWSFTEGGVKVLITGPWDCNVPANKTASAATTVSSLPASSARTTTSSAITSPSSYTVLFDAFPVPTTLVQPGVLRCFCPAHEAGLATVQVACNGFVISNAVIFEYKLQAGGDSVRLSASLATTPTDASSTSLLTGAIDTNTSTDLSSSSVTELAVASMANENLLRLSLYSRLEAVDERLHIKAEPKESSASSLARKQHEDASEERLVRYCQALTTKMWRSVTPDRAWTGADGHRGMTLLHLAAALGYAKLVCVLLAWRAENPNAVLETEVDALSQDRNGFTPLMWSLARGHAACARILYRWNGTAMNVRNMAQQSALEVCTVGGYAQLAAEFRRLEADRRERNVTGALCGRFLSGGSAEVGGWEEDTFRRQLTHSNPMFGSNPYLNVATASSTLDGNGAPGMSTATISETGATEGGRDALNNQLGGDILLHSGGFSILDSDCGSPMSLGSTHSSRSHDGVFLRPGAVSW